MANHPQSKIAIKLQYLDTLIMASCRLQLSGEVQVVNSHRSRGDRSGNHGHRPSGNASEKQQTGDKLLHMAMSLLVSPGNLAQSLCLPLGHDWCEASRRHPEHAPRTCVLRHASGSASRSHARAVRMSLANVLRFTQSVDTVLLNGMHMAL
jgi:hypothetical protein